jgi:2,3-bisphosphoglycerate-independent phosphoglycerate mutase
MKYLILVGDGMGDHPIAELDDATPLEAASTPTMDSLCNRGEFFLTHTVPNGYPPGSDVANLSLLGYSPDLYYTGRAPFEAASMGISLSSDETAFRCNLVTLERNGEATKMIDFSADHISSEEASELIEALETACGNAVFCFNAGISYRHLLTVSGPLPDFTTVPPHDHIGKDVTAFVQDYYRDTTWKNLLKKAEEILANHPVNIARIKAGKLPANGIWLWGQGKMPQMPTIEERFGIQGSMISAVDLLKGLGINAGLSVINVPGATGYIDTNYEGKAQAALQALEEQDFVFVHVEAPDEAGHQGSIKDKLQAIEDFDSRIVLPIIKGLQTTNTDFRAVVTMDHFTPIAARTHTGDPVPILLYDSREKQNGSGKTFCEKSARQHHAENNNQLNNGHDLIIKLLERENK